MEWVFKIKYIQITTFVVISIKNANKITINIFLLRLRGRRQNMYVQSMPYSNVMNT